MGKRERKISRFTGHWITEQGAGTVEYVIVVLVAIVIGSGLLAFGNQVSGQVTKTGNSISSWFSKANGTGGTGGGNAGGGGGAADNRIDELKEKDPADWTLDDQKAVAEDIGKKGNSSELYAKAKAAMDAGTTWSIQLTDGSTLTYRIIGINLIGTLVVIVICALTYLLGEDYLADIAVIYVVMSFIAVMMLCRIYINLYDRRRKEKKQHDR